MIETIETSMIQLIVKMRHTSLFLLQLSLLSLFWQKNWLVNWYHEYLLRLWADLVHLYSSIK